jgi:GNAT superfamily N-acetyltransferase
MVSLRAYRPTDLDSLYAVSLATGDAGGDATKLYEDGALVGHIYSAPYAVLAPDLALIAEDDRGVGGFAVGALNTQQWEAKLETDWWPKLRAQYNNPEPARRGGWSADARRAFMIHRPERVPRPVSAAYPTHLHLNLLPRLQGQGVGRLLFESWFDLARQQGSVATHVGVNCANVRAIRFWDHMGFQDVTPADLTGGRTVWMGRD